jgi:type II secretory pathway component PulM
MRARLTPAALLVVCVLAAGCGGDKGARRAAVSAYFDKVNVVQSRLAQPLLEVSKANRAFATGKADPAKVRVRLERSTRTFERLRKQLAAVDPPPDARTLQRLLLELVRRESELADETVQLARFVPRFAAALRPIGPAGRRLKAELNSKQPILAKAAALELYRDQLGAVLVQLRPLRPPPSSRPAFVAQLQTLAAVRASVTALARAIREKRNAAIGPLLHRFDLAATANQSLAAQRAQIAAIRAYNGRVHELDRLNREIALERARLEKLLR